MNRFALTIAIFMCQTAGAYDAENIRAFLKKNKNCVFAVYRVMLGKTTRDSFPQRFDISCIGDVKVGEGTIHEKHGCAAFNYNVETGKMVNLSNFGINIAENKTCADGGFETVLSDLLYTDNSGSSPRKVLVRDFFVPMRYSNEPSSFFRLVVYSEKDSYRTNLGYPKEDVDLKLLDVSKAANTKSKNQ